MAGNFMRDGYSIGYHSASGFVRFISQTNFTTEARYIDLDGSNSLAFSGGGTPGWDLQAVGDVNDDGFEDILVGAKQNTSCWLLYGGRGWATNYIALDAIGTNGMVLASEYSPCWTPWWPMYYPSVGRAIARLGDMNGDGADDFAYSDHGWDGIYHGSWVAFWDNHVDVVFGRPATAPPYGSYGLSGFKIKMTGNLASADPPRDFFKRIAGAGDVNGDGHNDILLIMYRAQYAAVIAVVYGGPFIKPLVDLSSSLGNLTPELNGTNGFSLETGVQFGSTYEDPQEWGNADISGDINGDGVNDILVSVGAYYRASNNAWVVYGGQSPSAPPALRKPVWINVGESATQTVEWTDVPTNIFWMGCKKGDDYCLAYTNGARGAAFDEPIGVLYFTNNYVLTHSSEQFSIAYTSTNALGPAAGYTRLTLHAVSEPILCATGVVAMASILLNRCNSLVP
jgi:hypothetical protein